MKLLVCGTRMKLKESMKAIISKSILQCYFDKRAFGDKLEIVEGCCPNSADEVAEIVAETNGIKVHHYPANSGNYLKRNIEMVNNSDMVLAFWDGYSYGTAHTIATAVSLAKPVKVILLK